MVFGSSANANWIIGYPFFKKYEFVFQPEQKLIGTYINYQKNKNSNDDKNNGLNSSMIVSIIVLVCHLQ